MPPPGRAQARAAHKSSDDYEAALDWVRNPREEATVAPAPAQEPARADPWATAQEMLQALSQSMVAEPVVDPRTAQDRLHAALDDSRLLDLDARWMFEGGIAVLIAEGWQPGHEFLVPAAIEIFRWRVEHSRLHGFGRAGQIVDSVITELDLYERHAPDLRLSLDKVMRLLRAHARPEAGLLMAHMQFVEHMARAYPHLVHVMTNPGNIRQWREWEAQAMAARPVPAPERPRHRLKRIADRSPGLILLAMLAVAFVLLLFTAPKAPERPGPGEVEVFQTSGHDTLDRAALDGVRGASFVPARGPDGQPINAWFIVPIDFTQDRK